MRRIAGVIGALMVALALAGLAGAAGRTTVIKAARMFDGKSGQISTPGVVVVTDGKIAGTGANAAVPAGAEVIDLGDATLMPAFIDAHTHLTMTDDYDYRK